MKKVYMAPAIEVVAGEMEELICASGVSGDNGMDYGGIDETGAMEAETRMMFNIFLFE